VQNGNTGGQIKGFDAGRDTDGSPVVSRINRLQPRKEYLWFGMQPNNIAMTPNGEMYWPKDEFKEDYSVEDARYQWWFMHEMVHVWQYQLGCRVKLRGIFSGVASYSYTLAPNKSLSDYGMEPQGNLLADYFLLLKYGDGYSGYIQEKQYRGKGGMKPLYDQVLKRFLANPSDKANLP